VRIRLIIQSGPDAGHEVVVDPSRPVMIGRAREVGLPLNDPRISKSHCLVAHDGQGFTVTDQGSSNGTWVNGVRVAKGPIRPGDILQIGTTDIQVKGDLVPTTAPATQPAAGDDLIGKTLGGYRILDRIAEGARGVVYRAEHSMMKRPGAVKVLSQAFLTDKKAVTRFLREARAGAALNHPHLVQVLDAGEDQGHHFLVMELVDGEPLQAIIDREGPLPLQRALHLTLQIATALDFAASQGLVHRDLRPANVLITRGGDAKVIDLGTALSLTTGGGQSLITTSGLPMHEANYVAPEILFGEKEIDKRADLYSLGITLYHMLTRKLPFAAGNAREFFESVKAEKYLSPRAHNQAIPEEVCQIIVKLMAKDRDERYPDAMAFLRDALGFYGRNWGTDTVPEAVLAIKGADEWAGARSGTRYESRVAQGVQAKMVPSKLPEVPGHVVSKVYRPAKVVGGDYYDVMELPGGKYVLVVLDAGMRGVSGAMVMVMARSVLQSSLELDLAPATALLHLDRSVRKDLPAGIEILATYAVLDTETGKVTYACAGDLPPILWRTSTGEACPLPGAGPAIGAESFERPDEMEVALDPGDRLVLYSDGAVRVQDTRKRPFGADGLAKALSRVGDVPLEGALERLTQAVEHHRGPAPAGDDLTLLGLERQRE